MKVKVCVDIVSVVVAVVCVVMVNVYIIIVVLLEDVWVVVDILMCESEVWTIKGSQAVTDQQRWVRTSPLQGWVRTTAVGENSGG